MKKSDSNTKLDLKKQTYSNMLVCKNSQELARVIAEQQPKTTASAEALLLNYLTLWESPAYELITVDGKSFTLPTHVTKYIREQREQIRQLQEHVRELQRDART